MTENRRMLPGASEKRLTLSKEAEHRLRQAIVSNTGGQMLVIALGIGYV